MLHTEKEYGLITGMRARFLCLLLTIFALFIGVAEAQSSSPFGSKSATGSDKDSDTERTDNFWVGNFPTGTITIPVSKIVAVAMHNYVLDGVCMVHEISVLSESNTPIKFYYLEPMGTQSEFNAVKTITNRAKELNSTTLNRITGGAVNADTLVSKKFPHHNTIEFRIPSKQQLEAVYSSLLKALEKRRGRNLSIK